MLARLTICTAIILLPGCTSFSSTSLHMTAGVGAGADMVEDDAYMLQGVTAVQLVDLPSTASIDSFCAQLETEAAAGPVGKATYAVECHAPKRLIRVLYTEDAVSHAIHFAILERTRTDGTRAISLQPIVAWIKANGGLGTVPVVQSSASRLVAIAGKDLRTLAAQAVSKL